MEKLIIILIAIATILVFSLILAYPIMLLWNLGLAPVIVGVSKITFWQAFYLKLLIGLLGYSSSTTE